MHARRLAAVLATGGLLLAAAPAAADPKGGETIPLACDDGVTYTIVTNGNGDFTPGHDVASNSMLIPVAFGSFTGTVTDAQGNVVETVDEPGIAKGNSGKNKKNLITCSFGFTFTEGGLTFTGSGTVTGFVTPRGGK